ncbi:hypothetical protein [Merdimmobilis hominis]|uniref:hypothetical protein n=1 Tax=Merdimmobilis hominis TaxID=2897707 RepID=UPI001897AD13|nr:hypothetical protein [Merdimmobilis hominis]
MRMGNAGRCFQSASVSAFSLHSPWGNGFLQGFILHFFALWVKQNLQFFFIFPKLSVNTPRFLQQMAVRHEKNQGQYHFPVEKGHWGAPFFSRGTLSPLYLHTKKQPPQWGGCFSCSQL